MSGHALPNSGGLGRKISKKPPPRGLHYAISRHTKAMELIKRFGFSCRIMQVPWLRFLSQAFELCAHTIQRDLALSGFLLNTRALQHTRQTLFLIHIILQHLSGQRGKKVTGSQIRPISIPNRPGTESSGKLPYPPLCSRSPSFSGLVAIHSFSRLTSSTPRPIQAASRPRLNWDKLAGSCHAF